MNSNQLSIFGCSLVSLVVGALVGYRYAHKALSAQYEEEFAREIEIAHRLASAKSTKSNATINEEFFQKHGPEFDPRELVLGAVHALEDYSPTTDDPPFEPQTPRRDSRGRFIKMNRAEEAKASVDLDNPTDAPVIISVQDFLQNDPENNQVTLTYYTGDGVLADERDEHIGEISDYIDPNALRQLDAGETSVYIRNSRLATDFEVIRSDGRFIAEDSEDVRMRETYA